MRKPGKPPRIPTTSKVFRWDLDNSFLHPSPVPCHVVTCLFITAQTTYLCKDLKQKQLRCHRALYPQRAVGGRAQSGICLKVTLLLFCLLPQGLLHRSHWQKVRWQDRSQLRRDSQIPHWF
jgi:hypothetical protein